MSLGRVLEGQDLTHREMGIIMIGWLTVVTLVSVGLLVYTSVI